MLFVKLDNRNNIEYIHHMPFDDINGLHKTREELLTEGVFVDSIPEPKQEEGKDALLRYNGAELYYEYVTRPLTPEEQTRQEIESLKAQNAQMLFALVEGGLL